MIESTSTHVPFFQTARAISDPCYREPRFAPTVLRPAEPLRLRPHPAISSLNPVEIGGREELYSDRPISMRVLRR